MLKLLNKKIKNTIFLVIFAAFALSAISAQAEKGGILSGASIIDAGGEKSIIATIKIPSIGGEDAQITPQVISELIEQKQDEVIHELSMTSEVKNIQKAQSIPVLSLTTSEEGVKMLRNNDKVVAIQENKLNFPTLGFSVPQINGDIVQDNGFTGLGQAVAILDTGSDTSHPFLNIISEACYSNSGGFGGGTSLCPGGAAATTAAGSGDDCAGIEGCDHGTHVAGIASGNKLTAPTLKGVAPNSDTIAIQVFTEYSAAQCGSSDPCLSASDYDIIQGLDRVLQLHNDISFTKNIAAVNLSLGGGLYSNEATCDSDNSATKTAIDALRAAGIATVIASGNNSNSTKITAPGCISSAIAVGSVDDDSSVSSFSNSNNLVDLLAPGGSIYSSVPGGSYATFAGTSMAAPHVAGTIALLKEQSPSATISELITSLRNEGTTTNDSRNGLTFPLIDVSATSAQLINLISVNILDDTTNEKGATATVEFSLYQQPTSDVTIPLSLSDLSEGTLSGVSEIIISDTTWNQPSLNRVTITGIDDPLEDGRITYQLITGAPSSIDARFDNLSATDIPDVTLYNTDDDSGDEVGLQRGRNFYLSYNHGSGADVSFSAGRGTDVGFSGDWDGDGIDEIGLKRGRQYFLFFNNAGPPDILFSAGSPSDEAISGDWDGDGIDEIGLKRGRQYFLFFNNAGPPDISFSYGRPSDRAIVGDWDGDGIDEIGLQRGKEFFLSFTHSSGADEYFTAGKKTDIAFGGDWDGDGIDEIGLKRGRQYFLFYDIGSPPVQNFSFGRGTDKVIGGDWDGQE